MPIDALSVLCAQLTGDLLAIAKFLSKQVLKQRFLYVSHGQTIIDNAIDEWHGRLRACVRAKGGHFEQLL